MARKTDIRNKILKNTAFINITIAVVLSVVMIFYMVSLTKSILLETMQPLAKIASQGVEGNIHIMADRIFMIGDSANFADETLDKTQKQALLDKAKSGIEYSWLALYNPDGTLYTGSSASPQSLSNGHFLSLLKETENIVIGDTQVANNSLEIPVGLPIKDESKNTVYYLVGSYSYDVLNDILSNINLGSTGESFIIDETGKFMAHHDVEKLDNGETIFTDMGEDEAVQSLVAKMSQGHTGVMQMSGPTGTTVVTYSPVRGTNWSLGISAPISDFMAPATRAIIVSLSTALLLLIGATLIMLRVVHQIQRPLARVTERISTLADGDLHSLIEVEHTGDETETLSQSLLDTVERINSYTSELSRVLSALSKSNLNVGVDSEFKGDFVVMKHSLNEIITFLNQIIHEIQNAAIEVATTSYTVHESASHIEAASGSQSELLSKLYEETTIISNNVDEVEYQANNMKEFMSKAVSSTTIGKQHMDSMVDSMERINENSEEIKKINLFLEDIAMQTNLLALNASIEAANAGAAGRGFAVVAREIGELAAKSQSSAHSTSQIIESSRAAVKDGVARAEDAAKAIREISEIADHISTIAKQLSESVTAEKSALSAITNQIGEINLLSSNNLDSSRQSVKASEILTQQADKLERIVTRFQLKQ